MKMITRSIQHLISRRLAEPAPLIQVLVGPRQVGKTTAVRGALAGRGLYFSADSPTPLRAEELRGWWQQALEHPDRLLAVDEIQKVLHWSELLKQLWDQQPGLKLVVTGSSALLVEKGLRETLAGRFELIRAEHWGFDEIAEAFDLSLEQFIEFGGYPGAARFLEDVERWAAYVRDSVVEPAIGRDLLQLHPVDHPALLRQVFGVAVSLPTRILSLQKMQGEMQTHRGSLPTLANYLRLLSEGFLVSAVRKYHPQPFHSRASAPKLIVHDNGLIRAFHRRPQVPLEETQRGYYLENAVGARLLEAGWETFYWRHRDWEVDFVALGPQGQRWAIEVKSGLVQEADLKGLRAFCTVHRDFQPCLLRLTPGRPFAGIQELDAATILSLHRSGAETGGSRHRSLSL